MKVLLVEDEDSIAEPLAEGLRREGFTVERAATGAEALAAGPADVVLLDLRLPDTDGYAVCRGLRERSDVPIIMVTARGEEVDKVIGLELGADDYVVKPFGLRELIARIHAVTRRTQPAPAAGPLHVGPLEVDVRARRARLDGAELALTAKEFDLLAALAAEPGAAVTRQQLLRAGLGHRLVRADEDDRRPRRLAAPQARRPGLDRDRARRRLPPAARAVSRRLLLSYVGAGAADPARARGAARDRVRPQRARRPHAERSSGTRSRSPRSRRTPCRGTEASPRSRALAARYKRDTGGRVVLVDQQGVSVVDSGAAVPRDFATRPEIAAALKGKVATGVRYSRTLGTNLLYVAEPVASGGVGARRGADHLPDLRGRRAGHALLADARGDRGGSCSRSRRVVGARARALGHAPAARAGAGGGRGGRRRPVRARAGGAGRPRCARSRPPSTRW